MNAKCTSCGAEIIWARTRNGKPIPLDASSVSTGNLVFAGGAENGMLVVSDTGRAMAGPRYVSHFTTCPHASQWRRGS